jgi:hypothetical protein
VQVPHPWRSQDLGQNWGTTKCQCTGISWVRMNFFHFQLSWFIVNIDFSIWLYYMLSFS